MSRKQVNHIRLELSAAICVERIYRGAAVRSKFRAWVIDRLQLRASIIIQKFLRGHVSRQYVRYKILLRKCANDAFSAVSEENLACRDLHDLADVIQKSLVDKNQPLGDSCLLTMACSGNY